MKDSLDMVEEVYELVNIPIVNDAIDGVVMKYQRPFKSIKTDVVVNAIALGDEAYQSGSFNINIHAPNLVTKFDDVTDNKQPNIPKFKQVWGIIKPLLEVGSFEDCNIYPKPMELYQDADGSWYANIKVDYYSFNEEFKN